TWLRVLAPGCVEGGLTPAYRSSLARHEGPLLGRARVFAGARREDRTLWRKYLVRGGPLRLRHARGGRRRDGNPEARQGAVRGGRGRAGRPPPAHQPPPHAPTPRP